MSACVGDRPDELAAPMVDDRLQRYDQALLRDAALQARVRAHGYAVLDPVLDGPTTRALSDLACEFLDRLGPLDGSFLTVGRVADLGLRAEFIARAGWFVQPALEPLFEPGTRFLCSAFQVKPPSPNSELSPHQDSSLVDESSWPGIYAWIPLVDTTEANGCLYVLPGSHRILNPHRTLSVPWQFAGMEEVFARHWVPLSVRRGGVVLFDSATVHGSLPNRSDRTRVALNNFARPAGAPLMHYVQDAATTPGHVDVWEIDQSFLYSDDIMARPGATHRYVGQEEHRLFRCDEQLLEDLCGRIRPSTERVHAGRP